MKKVIKYKTQKVPIQWDIFSDFDLKKPGYVKVIIEGGYGSNYDLRKYGFDMDDETTHHLLEFLKARLTKGKELRDFLTENDPW